MTQQPEAASQTFREAIVSLARILARDSFPRSDLAELRRLDTDAPSGPSFWRLVMDVIPLQLRGGEDREVRWALVLQGMAIMAPNHHASIPVGRALAMIGYSEDRLARLLNSRAEQFRVTIPRLCRQLAAHAQPLDWRQLGTLILAEGNAEDMAERVRRDIARAYYTQSATPADLA